MPYIKDPDFAELCVLIEVLIEINGDSITEKMITKMQNILKEYKK